MEPPNPPTGGGEDHQPNKPPPTFAEFWTAYPNTEGSERAAEKVWQRLTPDDRADAVALLKRLTTNPPTAYAATWLKDRRWVEWRADQERAAADREQARQRAQDRAADGPIPTREVIAAFIAKNQLPPDYDKDTKMPQVLADVASHKPD